MQVSAERAPGVGRGCPRESAFAWKSASRTLMQPEMVQLRSAQIARESALASNSFVLSPTLESGIPLPIRFLYVHGEQFWGRAVRASRDSYESGTLLICAGLAATPPAPCFGLVLSWLSFPVAQPPTGRLPVHGPRRRDGTTHLNHRFSPDYSTITCRDRKRRTGKIEQSKPTVPAGPPGRVPRLACRTDTVGSRRSCQRPRCK
jgi:hypothetical protein